LARAQTLRLRVVPGIAPSTLPLHPRDCASSAGLRSPPRVKNDHIHVAAACRNQNDLNQSLEGFILINLWKAFDDRASWISDLGTIAYLAVPDNVSTASMTNV
jgi:hypothetical protein